MVEIRVRFEFLNIFLRYFWASRYHHIKSMNVQSIILFHVWISHSSIDYTILEPTNASFTSYQPSSAWQPSTSAGSSYWTNQIPSTNNNNSASSPTSAAVQNISPTRSPGSPNYAASSPSATYHHLTPQNQTYQPPQDIYQSNGSPHYAAASQPPVVPVPQSHQLYYPSSLSPTHQIYGNVISPTGFGNFGYGAAGWHGTGDYGLFQSTYHYQPAEYIPIINEPRWKSLLSNGNYRV